MSIASDEARARRAAKKVGLAVRRVKAPNSPYGPPVHYVLLDPLNRTVVHHFLISPTEVMEACKSFTPPRHRTRLGVAKW
jgi:hypothetical protein